MKFVNEIDGENYEEKIDFGPMPVANAFFKDPDICLNLGTLNSAKDKIKTKKAIRSVAISAKVAIHAGAPGGGHLGHSCSSSSSTSSVASAIN